METGGRWLLSSTCELERNEKQQKVLHNVNFPCKYVMGPPITAASVQALTEVSAVRQG